VTFITSFVLFMLVFLYAISKMDQLETNPTLRTALIAVLTACTCLSAQLRPQRRVAGGTSGCARCS
jgi:hypothetical protein